MKKERKNKWLIALVIALAVILVVSFVGLLYSSSLYVDIQLNGDETVTLEVGDTYTDLGVTAFLRSTLLKGMQVEIPVASYPTFIAQETGDLTITYEASYMWLKEVAHRDIITKDSVAPVITLLTNPNIVTYPGQPYQEEGFTAIDNYDGDITHLVQKTETDTEVIYKVTDSSGNTTEVRRTIVYGDNTAPVLSLKGDTTITLQAGTSFTEPGFTASDNIDGDLTAAVVTDGQVNIYSPGVYTLTYSVTDAAGNVTTQTRTITIEAIKQPDIVDPGSKVIYLTFDDGPSQHTITLLEVLAKYNVKATFFVTSQSSKYTYLFKDIVDAGHAIGIHTYTHDYDVLYASKEAFFEDFYKIRQLIYDKTGVWTTLSRFPGGTANSVSKKYCPGIMTELVKDLTNMGYQYFDWNVTSGDDGTFKNSEDIFNRVTSTIANSSKDVFCVLQHDLTAYSVGAVESIIQWGLANGYTFKTLDPTSPNFHQTPRN